MYLFDYLYEACCIKGIFANITSQGIIEFIICIKQRFWSKIQSRCFAVYSMKFVGYENERNTFALMFFSMKNHSNFAK